jgi:hypothetical protein
MITCASSDEANSLTLTHTFHNQQVPDSLTALSTGLLNCLAVFFLQLPRTEVPESAVGGLRVEEGRTLEIGGEKEKA